MRSRSRPSAEVTTGSGSCQSTLPGIAMRLLFPPHAPSFAVHPEVVRPVRRMQRPRTWASSGSTAGGGGGGSGAVARSAAAVVSSATTGCGGSAGAGAAGLGAVTRTSSRGHQKVRASSAISPSTSATNPRLFWCSMGKASRKPVGRARVFVRGVPPGDAVRAAPVVAQVRLRRRMRRRYGGNPGGSMLAIRN